MLRLLSRLGSWHAACSRTSMQHAAPRPHTLSRTRTSMSLITSMARTCEDQALPQTIVLSDLHATFNADKPTAFPPDLILSLVFLPLPTCLP